jgi:hypothetical protein
MKKTLTPQFLISYGVFTLVVIAIFTYITTKNTPKLLSEVQSAQAQVVTTTETKEYVAKQMYNQDGANNAGNTVTSSGWIGTAKSTTASYAGFAFSNVNLPANATITNAQLQIQNVSRTTTPLSISTYAENSANPALFSKTAPPSSRILTTQKVPYTTTSVWTQNSRYTISGIQTVVAAVLPAGTTRNVNIIAKGTGNTNNNRSIYGTAVGKEPKLIITYNITTTTTPSPTASPTNSPTPSPTSTPTLTPSPTASSSATAKKIKVIEVRYFPFGPSQAVYQPDTLSTQLKTLLRNSSSFHKFNNPASPNTIDIETVAVYNYNTGRPNPDGTWRSSYDTILAQNNLCQQIIDQKVDQLWVWTDPRTGYDTAPGLEYVLSSKYFQDGLKIKNAYYAMPMFCSGQKDFTFFEFDYSRTADLALHSFGHFMEGLLGNIQSNDLFWKTYSGDPTTGTTRADKCGNVHFPPNGTADYDYSNQTMTTTSCEDWNPQLTGVKQTFNCTRWGCNQEGYLQWWLQNMPNANNLLTYQSKKLPNWWEFPYDTDNTIKKYNDDQTYYMDRNFLSTVPNTNVPEVNNVSRTTQISGTQIVWQHENTGANTLLVVSAAYRAHNNPNAEITSITYNSIPLMKVRRDWYADRGSEIWYLVNPPQGTFPVAAQFTADPEAQVFTAATVTNVDQSNPITAQGGTGKDILNSSIPDTQSLTVTSNPGDLVFAVLSSYPNGASNVMTPAPDNNRIWQEFSGNLHIESNGGVVRSNSTTTNIQWTSTQAFSYSLSGISIKLLP